MEELHRGLEWLAENEQGDNDEVAGVSAKRNQRAKAQTRLIADHLFKLHIAIMEWSISDLKAVSNDLVSLDGVNCWWFEKRAADAMRQIVNITIKEKEDNARRSAEILRDQL